MAREVYSVWFENLRLWLTLSVLPFAAVIVVSLIVEPQGKGSAEVVFDTSWALVWLIYLVQIPQATAWHRLILQPHLTDSHRYTFGWNERLYFLKALILMFLLGGVIILFGLLAGILTAPLMAMLSNSPIFQAFGFSLIVLGLVYLAVGYFVCPLVLMLPAASIGKRLSSGEAYMIIRKGRNNARLAIAYLVVLTPVMFIDWVAVSIVERMNSGNDVLANLLMYTPGILYAPALVGVISITYRELVQKPEAMQANAV